MEIEINITRNDFAEFNKYYYFKKGIKKRILIIIIVAFILPFFINYGEPFYLNSYLLDIVLSAIIFGSFLMLSGYLRIKRSSKLPSEDGSMLGEKRLIIEKEGLVEDSATKHTLQKWQGIKSIEENKNYIYIFVDNISAHVIPKRYFSNQEECNRFIAEVKKHHENSI